MPSQTTKPPAGFVTIRIGDQDWDKPWVASCAACASPWLGQIDNLLASGWSAAAIVSHLRSRKPAPPRAQVIGAHVVHLAQPHYEQRIELDRQQGASRDPGVPSPDLRSVADVALQRVLSGMATGAVTPPLRDVIAARRQLQQEAADSAGHASQEMVQAALMEIFELARRHLAGPAWEAFARDVYGSEALASFIRPRQAVTAKENGNG